MTNFTPVSAAIGGVLIGLSAVLLMLFTGRIAGISGIFGGLITPQTSDPRLANGLHRWPYRCAWYSCNWRLSRADAAGARQLHHNHHRRLPGRVWRQAWDGLHIWPRHLRHCAIVTTFYRGHLCIYDGGNRRGRPVASRLRRLSHANFRKFPLRFGVRLWIDRVQHDPAD
jgi:hypothetical protein